MPWRRCRCRTTECRTPWRSRKRFDLLAGDVVPDLNARRLTSGRCGRPSRPYGPGVGPCDPRAAILRTPAGRDLVDEVEIDEEEVVAEGVVVPDLVVCGTRAHPGSLARSRPRLRSLGCAPFGRQGAPSGPLTRFLERSFDSKPTGSSQKAHPRRSTTRPDWDLVLVSTPHQPASPPPARLLAFASEYRIGTSRPKAPAGVLVAQLKNNGQDDHDLAVRNARGQIVASTGVVDTAPWVSCGCACGPAATCWCARSPTTRRAGCARVLVVRARKEA